MWVKDTCGICETNFTKLVSPSRIGRGKFCSRKCYEISKRGKPSWNKGKSATWMIGNVLRKGKKNPFLAKFNRSRHGKINPKWKGDSVEYRGLHLWIERTLGKSQACQHCPKAHLTGHKIHWANRSGKYLRDVNDWLRLCVKCHREFDRKKGRLNE